MTDDLSKVVREMRAVAEHPHATTPERKAARITDWADRLESAATPAEVDVPTIDRDEAFQRDYIPLGRSGWEIQTKGKGSTYRLCEPDGHRLAIPNEPYLHETMTRMARDVHADYTTLARQLAEARALAYVMPDDPEHGLLTWKERTYEESTRAEQAESQLAEATRRLEVVEGLLRKWAALDAGAWNLNRYEREKSDLTIETKALLTKEPTK